MIAVNSGPPSVVTSSGMPKVTNVVRRAVMSPAAPLMDRSSDLQSPRRCGLYGEKNWHTNSGRASLGESVVLVVEMPEKVT